MANIQQLPDKSQVPKKTRLERLPSKVINGEGWKQATHRLTDEFLKTGASVEGIRGIWYKIKHKIEAWKPFDVDAIPPEERSKREENWTESINTAIGARLFNIYNEGDVNVYNRVGIGSKALSTQLSIVDIKTKEETTENATNPIVLVSEKQTSKLQTAAIELGAAQFISSGEVPSFEATFIISYLLEHLKDGHNAYVLVITDYDPAGLQIFKSLQSKLTNIFNKLSPEVELVNIRVGYGEHDDIIKKYDSYLLPLSGLKKWQPIGLGERGVELDVIHDIREHIDSAILKYVDPSIFEELSVERARQTMFKNELANSEEHSNIKNQLEAIRNNIESEVYSYEYDFETEPEWHTPVRYDMIEHMTTISA